MPVRLLWLPFFPRPTGGGREANDIKGVPHCYCCVMAKAAVSHVARRRSQYTQLFIRSEEEEKGDRKEASLSTTNSSPLSLSLLFRLESGKTSCCCSTRTQRGSARREREKGKGAPPFFPLDLPTTLFFRLIPQSLWVSASFFTHFLPPHDLDLQLALRVLVVLLVLLHLLLGLPHLLLEHIQDVASLHLSRRHLGDSCLFDWV